MMLASSATALRTMAAAPMSPAPIFTEPQFDVLSDVVSGLRVEIREAVEVEMNLLRERIARLEGECAALMTMFGTEPRSAGPRRLLKP